MKEDWRDVVGYEEYFKVSNIGRVWSKRTNRILKQVVLKDNGYKIFTTRIGGRDGKVISFRVHVLVAEAFLEEPEDYQKKWAMTTKYKRVLVNHKDSNKANNRADNLEWVTASENITHFNNSEKGTQYLKSANMGSAILTNDQVIAIRREYSLGGTSERKLASRYGVSRGVINNALNRYAWVA